MLLYFLIGVFVVVVVAAQYVATNHQSYEELTVLYDLDPEANEEH